MIGDPKRSVSAAPPPRREVEVNLDADVATDEGAEQPPARPLDLGGFSDPSAVDGGGGRTDTDGKSTSPKLKKATRRGRKPTTGGARNASATAHFKTTVLIPNDLVDSLRSWTSTTGRTIADAVLTAYLNQFDAVRQRFAATADDEGRAELGLPPIASTGPSQSDATKHRRIQVGLFIQAGALDKLDASAEELSLSRSQFVTELLSLELGVQSS